MALAAVLGVGAAGLAATLVGGPRQTAVLAGAAVAGGIVPTFAPALVRGPRAGQMFGVVVVGASMVRLLLTLGVAMLIVQMRDVATRPFAVGLIAGAGLVLVIESAMAVWVLSRMQARRALERG